MAKLTVWGLGALVKHTFLSPGGLNDVVLLCFTDTFDVDLFGFA